MSRLFPRDRLLLRWLSRTVIGLGILLASWLALSAFQKIVFGVMIIPDPLSTIAAIGPLVTNGIYGITLIEHVGMSFARVLLGFFFALLLAVPFGLFLGLSNHGRQIFEPAMDLIRPIPPIAWVPVAIILFGLTMFSYAFIIFIGAFFPLVQNIIDGVRRVKPVYRDVALSLGASRLDVIRSIILPAITPNILTGARVSMGISWMCVIAAEMIGVSDGGIGYFINDMKNIGNYVYMMAGMLMLAVVGLGISMFFLVLERYIIKWVETIS
ncbi:MAG: ABC transporter permease [Candidatus Sigynarchaeota archaeon]